MRNQYANGPAGFLEAIVRNALPEGALVIKQQQQPTTQWGAQPATNQPATGWGAGAGAGAANTGWGAKPGVSTFGKFGAGAQQQQQGPPITGITTEDQLKAVQQSLALSQNLRAGAMQVGIGQKQDVIDRFSYFSQRPSQFAPQQQKQVSFGPQSQLGFTNQSAYQSAYNQQPALGIQQQSSFGAAQQQPSHVQLASALQQSLTKSQFNLSSQVNSKQIHAQSSVTNPMLSSNFQLQSQIKSQFLQMNQSAASQQQPLNETKNLNAPILMRQEYLTSPPIESLRRMSDEELSFVQNFSIKRIRAGQIIGQITFKSPVNLVSVNLDGVVQIEPQQCSLVLSSPTSFQLNVPAVISLYGVFSAEEDYDEKIRQATLAVGGRLVLFDRERGEWVFEVDGFM